MPQPNQKRSPALLRRLVDVIQETGNVSEACRRCGIKPDSAYGWRELSRQDAEDERFRVPQDPLGDEPPLAFHVAWERAIDIAMDRVEAVALMLATGYQEPVVHQGRECWRVDPLSMEVDPITGDVRNRLVVDPITGDPVPLTVTKYEVRAIDILLKAHRASKFRERVDVSVTDPGRPIAVPARVTDVEQWKRDFGVRVEGEDDKK